MLNQDAQSPPHSPTLWALADFGDALRHQHAWLARTADGRGPSSASSSTMGALRPEHDSRIYIRDSGGMGRVNGRQQLHPRVRGRRK